MREQRPACPKCGMNMISSKAEFECLRCGHQEKRTIKDNDDKGRRK
jgi:exosome complex RNA-binding protein Csl4